MMIMAFEISQALGIVIVGQVAFNGVHRADENAVRAHLADFGNAAVKADQGIGQNRRLCLCGFPFGVGEAFFRA